MLIILDRDGVINVDRLGEYVSSPEDWDPIPGSIEAIARLSQAGYRIAIATNQAGLAKGVFGLDELEGMHAKMIELVEDAGGAIDGVFYCPHKAGDGCGCRKPEPGLLRAIERELGISVAGAPLVGDKLSDMQLAEAGGCRPFLVGTGYGSETREQLGGLSAPGAVTVVSDLAAAVDVLLERDQ